MAKSIAASSTKASLSGKAASLKKKVQKGGKALARPFKKLKASVSTSPSRLARSPSITTLPASDNDTLNIDNHSKRSSIDSADVHGTENEADVELSPEDQLGVCFSFVINFDSKSMVEELKKHWRSPIYLFFKPDVAFQYHQNRPCHFFTCAAAKCKVRAGGVRRFQDSKDK